MMTSRIYQPRADSPLSPHALSSAEDYFAITSHYLSWRTFISHGELPIDPLPQHGPLSSKVAVQPVHSQTSRPSPGSSDSYPTQQRSLTQSYDPADAHRPLITARIEKLGRGDTIYPPCDRYCSSPFASSTHPNSFRLLDLSSLLQEWTLHAMRVRLVSVMNKLLVDHLPDRRFPNLLTVRENTCANGLQGVEDCACNAPSI